MSAPILSTCFACGVPTLRCVCDLQPELMDPSKPWCPCCGEDDWCTGALAEAGAGWESLPELVMGTAPMAPRWSR